MGFVKELSTGLYKNNPFLENLNKNTLKKRFRKTSGIKINKYHFKWK